MAKGCFDVQKGDFCERLELFAAVLLYLDKDMLIRGKCKFLLELPRNIFQKIPKNSSPCVRSIVKSSSLNGLEILQN